METGSGISEGRADYKAPGGKLIRVRVRHKDGIIESIMFNGDFFIHPEEAIEELEQGLKGKSMDEADDIVDSFFERVESAGAGADDFKNALRLAIKE